MWFWCKADGFYVFASLWGNNVGINDERIRDSFCVIQWKTMQSRKFLGLIMNDGFFWLTWCKVSLKLHLVIYTCKYATLNVKNTLLNANKSLV